MPGTIEHHGIYFTVLTRPGGQNAAVYDTSCDILVIVLIYVQLSAGNPSHDAGHQEGVRVQFLGLEFPNCSQA